MIMCSSIVAFPPTRSSSSHLHTPDINWVNKLPDYPIPKEVQKDIDLQNRLNNFKPWLLRENYKERLHLLLWVEEAQQHKNIRWVVKNLRTQCFSKYDLRDVTFEKVTMFVRGGKTIYAEKEHPFARLKVPGLAENRTSILYSDSV
jgi:hypothetical protein